MKRFSLSNHSAQNNSLKNVNDALQQAHDLYNAEYARQWNLWIRQHGKPPADHQHVSAVASNTLRALDAATRRILGQ